MPPQQQDGCCWDRTDACCWNRTDSCCSGKLWLCLGVRWSQVAPAGVWIGGGVRGGGRRWITGRGLGRPAPHFFDVLGGLKINPKMVPTKWRKLSPKGIPKVSQNHQNGLQKPSQNGVPKKHWKIIIFSTPKCCQSVINNVKIYDFQVLVLTPFGVSFWKCFGSPSGRQSHQKAI